MSGIANVGRIGAKELRRHSASLCYMPRLLMAVLIEVVHQRVTSGIPQSWICPWPSGRIAERASRGCYNSVENALAGEARGGGGGKLVTVGCKM